jgi:hypothetical protein
MSQGLPLLDVSRGGGRSELVRPSVSPPGVWGWLLVGSIAIGAMLRLAAASHGGLWRDEALFLFVSRIEPFTGLLNFLRLHESHPPGFYILMRWWSELLGRSESAAIELSLGFGIALIPLAYLAASRLFTRQVGIFAAALVAVSPPMVKLSILVRPYAMLCVLCVFTAYLLWECLSGAGKRTWLMYGIAMVVMLYTHNWTLLLFVAHTLIGLIWLATRRAPVRRELLRPWLLTQVSILLLYAPWVPILIYQFLHAGHEPSPKVEAGPYIVAAKVLAGSSLWYVLFLMLFSGVAGWLTRRRAPAHPRGEAFPLGLGITAGIPVIVIALALVLSPVTNLVPPWCVAVLSPLVLLTFAGFLAWVYESGARRQACLAGAGLLALYVVTWHREVKEFKSNAREMAAAVAARAGPRDLVVLTPVTLAPSFNYYFRLNNPQIDFPSLRREQMVEFNERYDELTSQDALANARARIDSAKAQGRRVWFVMTAKDMKDRFVRPLLPSDTARHYLRPLAVKESNQLRQYLISLYGRPALTLMPRPGDKALELLAVLLFENRASSVRRRSPDEVPASSASRPASRSPIPLLVVSKLVP